MGDCLLYVSTTNDKGLCKMVTSDIEATWNKHWMEENDHFEKYFNADLVVKQLPSHTFLFRMATTDWQLGQVIVCILLTVHATYL